MKVFLGGTCNGSKWREHLITLLTCDYFNPVVDDWTEDCQVEEIRQREEICDFCLYVITAKMKGFYSIAEVIDDSNKRPRKTIFCYLDNYADDGNFTPEQLKSLEAIGKMVKRNGGCTYTDLSKLAIDLNIKDLHYIYQ